MDRRTPRRAVDRPAKIYIGDDDPLPCRVRDLSDGGAKLLVFCNGARLPNSFDVAEVFSCARRTVSVVWTGLSGVVVRFVDEGQSPLELKPKCFGRRHS